MSFTRHISARSAFNILVGKVIGSGIFMVATQMFIAVPNPAAMLGIWIFAGLMTILGGICFAELGSARPLTGGAYIYLRECYGERVGFLYGWTLVFIIQTGSIAAVAVVFAHFFVQIFGGETGPWLIKLIGSAGIIAFSLANLRSGIVGRRLSDVFTVVKIGLLLILAFGGIVFGHQSTPLFHSQGTLTVSGCGLALIAAFWAYDGWDGVFHVAGEVIEPEKNLRRVIWTALPTVAGLYVLVNIGYLRLLSPEAITAAPVVAADAFRVLSGEWGLRLAAAFIVIATGGSLNNMIFAGARVAQAMAERGQLPAKLAQVVADKQTPRPSLWLQMIWSLVLFWIGGFEDLYTGVICAAFIFYGLTALCLLKKQGGGPSGMPAEAATAARRKVPTWVPVVYASFILWFVMNAFVTRPMVCFIGAGVIVLGLPLYEAMKSITNPA